MITSSTVTITLPGGFWLDGACHKEAGLRPLTGKDEAFLLEAGQSLLPVRAATALLVRCLTRLGPLHPATTDAVGSLTVGDREALLLHLRRLTLGDQLQSVLTCPAPACGQKMDLDLAVGDLLLPPYPRTQMLHDTTVSQNGTAYRVRFRLPTGADQEAAACLARNDPQAAAELVLSRCVESVTAHGGDEQPVKKDWPPAVAEHLPALMAELDPQAELTLSLTCPACGHVFSALFDTATYFFQELAVRTTQLYREVHLLALHYHWSETEIMRMTPTKRRRYLELLQEALAEGRRR